MTFPNGNFFNFSSAHESESHSVVSNSLRPMGYSLPGSSVHGVLQARILKELPFPSPGVLPNPGIERRSPALQADSLPSELPGKLMRHPLTELFYLSDLLQMPNDCRMVDVEFFGNCPCCCKRISFDDLLSWSLSTFHGQSLCPHLQGSCFLCKTSPITTEMYVY